MSEVTLQAGEYVLTKADIKAVLDALNTLDE
jgi:hypothetical protein